ncbi:MAG: proline--tRNA ligase, partial [Leptospiraceae bacterium]|nr:proline--tRNA ligase [Leptospiraceae bacterium]
KVDVRAVLKTVVFLADGKPVGICLRGDRQLNEVKLKNHLGANELVPAEAEDIKAMGSVAGFVAPLHLKNTTILWDRSVLTGEKWITGSNRADYHCLDFVPEPERESFDFALAVAGDPSPAGDGLLKEMKGIEVGHIFKLGRKYTDAFQISVLDENGKAIIPTMGCYGVGVNRTLATVIEQWHDDAGIKWPISAAPFEVCLIDIARQPEEKAQAEALYTALCTAGVDVFWDDRDARPGIKFNDADLIGYPIRITMGKSYFQNGELEVNDRSRDESHKWTGNTEELLEKILKLRTELYALLEQRVQQSLMD